jgi:hypothetical protein
VSRVAGNGEARTWTALGGSSGAAAGARGWWRGAAHGSRSPGLWRAPAARLLGLGRVEGNGTRQPQLGAVEGFRAVTVPVGALTRIVSLPQRAARASRVCISEKWMGGSGTARVCSLARLTLNASLSAYREARVDVVRLDGAVFS